MKGIIAETGRSVYQISRCFRNAESVGSIHNPEFSMLEWYAVGGDRLANVAALEALVESLPMKDERLSTPFRRMTMAQAFAEIAGIDLDACAETGALLEQCELRGIMSSLGDSWEAAFNRLFLNLVEPELPMDRPLVLDEYPAGIDCLARLLPGGRSRARWELYAGGMELANCYEEERDPAAVSAYLEREAALKARQAVPHAIDRGLPELFSRMPPCSGVALGLDRLLAILLGKRDIASLMIGEVFS
jgi:lysyl-tRNA synthetase class 2